jgi:hypothetical protein
MDMAEYSGDLFRRVIYLGGSGTNQTLASSPSSEPAKASSTEGAP